MLTPAMVVVILPVALRKESVDRNALKDQSLDYSKECRSPQGERG